MSSSAERWACDTSVAIPALDATHTAHGECRHVLVSRRPALAGHAALESYSVLTRLPPPFRLTAAQAATVLASTFPDDCRLDETPAVVLSRLADCEIVGGSVYDGLVGEAARQNGRILLTRDRRAERTYRVLDVSYEFVG